MGIKAYQVLVLVLVVVAAVVISIPTRREFGILLARSARPERAHASLRAHLAAQPDDALAMRVFARVCERTGRPVELVTVLQRYLVHQPADEDERLRLIRTLRELRRFEEALVAAAYEPWTDRRRRIAADLAEHLGRLPEAIAQLRALGADHAVAPHRARRVADLLFRSGEVAAAMRIHRRLGEYYDDVADIGRWLDCANVIGDDEALVAALRRLEDHGDWSRLPYHRLYLMRQRFLQLRERQGTYRAARVLIGKPEARPDDVLLVARLHLWGDDPVGARRVLEDNLERFPRNWRLRRLLAELYHQAGDYDQARRMTEAVAGMTKQYEDLLAAAYLSGDADRISVARNYLDVLGDPLELRTEVLVYAALLALQDDDLDAARHYAGILVTRARRDDDRRAGIEAAELLQPLGDPASRLRLLEELAAEGALPPRFLLELAEAALDTGSAAVAIEWLERIDAVPEVYIERALRIRAHARLRQAWAAGDDADAWRRAGSAVDACLAVGLDDPFMREGLVAARLGTGNRPGAERAFAYVADPSHDLVLDLAAAAVDDGANDRATELLSRPPTAETALRRARLLAASGRRAAAAEAYRALVAVDDPDRAALIDWCYFQLEAGAIAGAHRAYRRLELLPASLQVRMAAALLAKGRREEAEEIRAGIPTVDLGPDQLRDYAWLSSGLRRDRAAAETWRRLAGIDPRDRRLLLWWAEAAARAGSTDTAATVYGRYASGGSGAVDWREVVRRAADLGLLGVAQELLAAGLRRHPRDAGLLRWRLVLAVRGGDPALIMEAYAGLPDKGLSVDLLEDVAAAAEATGAFERALAVREHILRRDPSRSDVLLDLARGYAERGMMDAAEVAYDRYCRQRPEDGIAWYEWAELRWSRDRDAARQEHRAREALRTRGDPEALGIRGTLAVRHGEVDLAMRCFERAAGQGSLAPHPACDYAGLLLRAGYPARARRQVEDLLRRAPRFRRAQRLLGACYLAEGRLEQALRHLRALRLAYPENSAVVRDLAAAEERAGNVERARRLYRLLGREAR